MNILIPKAERKAALLSFLGLVVLTAVMCAIQLSTHHLPVREYLTEVALGGTSGAIGGAAFGYVGWLTVTAVRRLISDCFIGATQVVEMEIEKD